MTARTDAQALHERKPANALELDLDYCLNGYGVSPCTAGRIESGTAQAGAASTLTLRSGASGTDDFYNGKTLGLLTGPGSIQERRILDYVGSTKVATVSAPWRRNALTKSSAVDHSNWTKQNGVTITAGYALAPDGSMKADRAEFPDGTLLPRYFQTVSGFAGQTVCFSLMMRSNTGANQSIELFLRETGFGTVHATTTVTVTPEWQRFKLSGAIPGGSSAVMALVYHSGGPGTWDIIVCEHQWNLGSEPDDFVETDTVAVTVPDATTTYAVVDRVNACYNVFHGDSPCQDPSNYVKGVKVIKFCDRGMKSPPGELSRPYIMSVSPAATVIDAEKGLSMRSETSVELTDEPSLDVLDKYQEDRTTPAGSTYMARLIARNPNAPGRFARLRKGYVKEPWSWDTFQTELFMIEAMRGLDSKGHTKLVLTDAIKLLDRSKVPSVTDGKLTAELLATTFSGVAVSATSTTLVLPEAASAVDDFYNGQELIVLTNVGAGQRRVISDYVGATRTATVSAWLVVPNSTSGIEITQLSLTLTTGKGAQYTDPATSGKNEYVRLKDEIIRYTAKSGDTLSWTDGTYRAQFNTTRDDHKVKDLVQLCRAWLDTPAKAVIEQLMNEGGLLDTYIDLAGLAVEDLDWLQGARISACIADPETVNDLLADLFKDLNMLCWWHPVEQKVKFKVDMPQLSTSVVSLTDSKLVLDQTQVERLDAERITAAVIDYNLATPTVDRKQRVSYETTQAYIDQAATGPNLYNDSRPVIRQSRWLTSLNDALATSNVARKLSRLRDAPFKIKIRLDPRDEVSLGALVDVTTRKMVSSAGQAKTVRCRVVKLTDAGSHFTAELLSTVFARRYAFIAPNGYPTYPSATAEQRLRAFISSGATMSDGTSAYLIS